MGSNKKLKITNYIDFLAKSISIESQFLRSHLVKEIKSADFSPSLKQMILYVLQEVDYSDDRLCQLGEKFGKELDNYYPVDIIKEYMIAEIENISDSSISFLGKQVFIHICTQYLFKYCK